MAIHCSVNVETLKRLKTQGRECGLVSRGGSFISSWMVENKLENPLYKNFDYILDIAKEYDISTIVIGLPKNMDGTLGFRADITKDFAKDLEKEISGVTIIFQDERLTTVQASGILNVTNTRGKSRKGVIDTVAAEIILQSYLDSNKNS